MKKQFIIISLKHTEEDGIMFWNPDRAGYTYNPFRAGVYEEEDILNNLDYYHSGNSLVVGLRDQDTLRRLGVIGGKLKAAECKEYYKEFIAKYKTAVKP